MRWVVLLVMVVGCVDDSAFRPIADIAPVSCHETAWGYVYGSVLIGDTTDKFGAVTAVLLSSASLTTPDTLDVSNDTLQLFLKPFDVPGSFVMRVRDSTKTFATALVIQPDCGASAGRFEVQFPGGGLSGWYFELVSPGW